MTFSPASHADMRSRATVCALFLGLGLSTLAGRADNARLTVELERPGVAINRNMWGIFFEDINFGADGGLYAELVKNRGFEFPERAQPLGHRSSGKKHYCPILF